MRSEMSSESAQLSNQPIERRRKVHRKQRFDIEQQANEPSQSPRVVDEGEKGERLDLCHWAKSKDYVNTQHLTTPTPANHTPTILNRGPLSMDGIGKEKRPLATYDPQRLEMPPFWGVCLHASHTTVP